MENVVFSTTAIITIKFPVVITKQKTAPMIVERNDM